jgi:hypothetical protein
MGHKDYSPFSLLQDFSLDAFNEIYFVSLLEVLEDFVNQKNVVLSLKQVLCLDKTLVEYSTQHQLTELD